MNAGYSPNAVVLNSADWLKISTLKNTQGDYLLGGAVQSAVRPVLWGVRVVQSPAMAAGKYLVMDGPQAATLCDREQANTEMTRYDQDDFVKNMVKILGEERIALAVENPGALVKGAFATTP